MAGTMWGPAAVRRRWLIFSLAGAIMLLPAIGQVGRTDDRNTGPPRSPPRQPEPPPRPSTVSIDSPLSLTSDDGWHPNLLRERQLELRLKSAKQQLAEQNFSGALNDLQFILDRPDDVFVRVDWEPVPRGAHAAARRLMEALPTEALRTYESLYGSEARAPLAQARKSGDAAAYSHIVRRYFYTAAGFEAADWLTAREMDHGRFALAAALWEQVLGAAAHRPRMRSAHYLRAAYCLEMLGDKPRAREQLQHVRASDVTVAGKKVTAGSWLAEAVDRERSQRHSQGTLAVGGGPCRNGVTSGTVPSLASATWSATLAGGKSEHLRVLAAAVETYQLQQGLPLGAAHFPLLIGDKVVFRDYEGIRAIELQSGSTYWRYDCETSLLQRVPAPVPLPSEGSPPDQQNHLQNMLTGNSLLGMLSSDGQSVFAVDQLDAGDRPGAARNDGTSSLPQHTNRLLALELSPPAASDRGARVRWSVGGPRDESEAASRPLAGHFFLGPPLATEDRLYAVSECDQQLHVTCLDPSAGTVVWMQVICAVPQPIGLDQQRTMLDCSPALAEGTLVVPTQAGLLVALEPVTGTLRWASACDDAQLTQKQQSSSWPYAMRSRFGHPGYPSPPVIHSGHAILLPVHSEYVHAINLRTGSVSWRARRADLEAATAGEYVAAVTGRTVLMIGRRRCRGLALDTGRELWSVRLGSTPAGRGVCTAAGYLVPCDDGRILAFDPDTGRQTGWSHAQGGVRLGNLVLGGDLVVSLGRTDICAFPQAGKLLEKLAAHGEERLSAAQSLEAAELELALGRTVSAKHRLQALRLATENARLRERADDLYRDVLLAELASGAAEDSGLLAELEPLMRTPQLRARLWLERGRKLGSDPAITLAAARELASIALEHPLAISDDPSRSIMGPAAARGLLNASRVANEDADPMRLDSVVAIELDEVLRSRELSALRRFTRLYDGWPQADHARLRLAEVAIEQARGQLAEVVLLEARRSVNPQVRGAATRLLSELWSSRDRHSDAALLLEDLATRFAAVEVAPGRTGTDYLEHHPRNQQTWAAYRRLEEPRWALSAAKISTQPASNEQLQTLGGNGVQAVLTPRNLSLQLWDQGRGSGLRLTMLDRRTGTMYPETIEIPGRPSYSATMKDGGIQHSYVGHFCAFGTAGKVQGVSLLDRKVVWEIDAPGGRNANDVVRVGPAGTGFAAFQSRQNLFVVDPADGRLLWHRNDLEGSSGLVQEWFDGIIGDERVLVVFHGNRGHYTLYDTETGAEMRRGKLDIRTGHTRRSFGRMYVHFTSTPENRRLRVWDAQADRVVWEVAADSIADRYDTGGTTPGMKVLTYVRDADELAFVTTDGRLRVVEIATGTRKFDLPLAQEQVANLNSIAVFRDRERYYFHLQRQLPKANPPPAAADQPAVPAVIEQSLTDSGVAAVHLDAGELLAADRTGGQVVWSRLMGRRTLFQFADLRLPVLLQACKLRQGDQAVSLCVEVLDLKTGEVVASHRELPEDRFLHAEFEPESARIAFRGVKNDVHIDFATDLARAGGSGR